MAKSLLRTNNEISEIYGRHVKTIYRVCYTYLKNSTDTEDIVSDTFIKMIKVGPVFESEEHEKAWLIRTATNCCKDFLKHWSRHNKDLSDYSETLKIESEYKDDVLLETICSLPDKYKTVIHLYYYEGYTSVQIAKIMQKPESTIRNYLHEARSILRNKLGGDFDEK